MWSQWRLRGSENVCSDIGPLSSLSHFLAVLSRQDRYQLRIGSNSFAATVSKSTATAAPAPVVKYFQLALTFQTAPATITRHEQGRHSRRVATASGWPWCTPAEWSAGEFRVDDDRD